MPGMTIDFNHVRENAIKAYSALVTTLKHRMEDDRIVVDKCEIESDLDDLRSAVVAIGTTYEEGNGDFRCVLGDTVLPSLDNEEEPD